ISMIHESINQLFEINHGICGHHFVSDQNIVTHINETTDPSTHTTIFLPSITLDQPPTYQVNQIRQNSSPPSYEPITHASQIAHAEYNQALTNLHTIPPSRSNAIWLLRQAAGQGHAASLLCLARAEARKGNRRFAIARYTDAVNVVPAIAAYELAVLLEGEETFEINTRDLEDLAVYERSLCKTIDPGTWWLACCDLGEGLLASGNFGIRWPFTRWVWKSKIRQARELYFIAACNGNPWAMRRIARAYWSGLFGLTKDDGEAGRWMGEAMVAESRLTAMGFCV
ncbi:hypothetical protein HK096_001497, partial [Nowakowskiella sp. JEL0078]